MKKAWNRCAALLLALLLCVSMVPAYAADAQTVDVSPEVTVKITGDISSTAERTYTFRLTPVSENAPMPANAVTDDNGTYSDIEIKVTGTGEAKASFGPITFSRVGEYLYQVKQIPGDYSRCNYDSTVYNVKITIFNEEDETTGEYKGLTYQVAVRKEGDETATKTELNFTNHYRSSPSHRDDPKPKPEEDKTYLAVDKLWVGGKNHPTSVTIELRDGETLVDTVTLGDWNNWHYSWHDLDASVKRDWNVVEVNVPDGYTVSYSFNGTTFTVRNTEKLIQTGQLNWPVPVMAVLGLALLCVGIAMLRKKKESGNA